MLKSCIACLSKHHGSLSSVNPSKRQPFARFSLIRTKTFIGVLKTFVTKTCLYSTFVRSSSDNRILRGFHELVKNWSHKAGQLNFSFVIKNDSFVTNHALLTHVSLKFWTYTVHMQPLHYIDSVDMKHSVLNDCNV